jgi:hypothetical protein
VLGWKYFLDADNIIDILFAVSFFITWTFEVVCGTKLGIEDEPNAHWTRITLSVLLLCGFMKGLAQMRAFTQFSFIVRMVQIVIVEMVPFLALFLAFTVVCAMVMFVLGVHLGTNATGEEGDDITDFTGLGFFGHIVYTLNNSLGEFQVEQITALK